MIGKKYNNAKDKTLSVAGLQSNEWDDCLAGVSVGQEQLTSKIFATDTHFITLINSAGVVTVWHAETCEKTRQMHHKKYASMMFLNKSQTILMIENLHTYRVWNISSGNELYCFSKTSQASMMAFIFDKIDFELVIDLNDCFITCYDFETSVVFWCFLTRNLEFLECFKIMTLNSDMSKVIIAWKKKPFMIWNMRANETQESEQCKIYHENNALCAWQKIEWRIDKNFILTSFV